MLSAKFATPLVLERRQSYYLFCYLSGIHLAALVAAFIIEVELWLKIILCIIIFCSCLWNLYSSSRFSSGFIYRLEWGEFYWKIFSRQGGESIARLKNNGCIYPFFIVLALATDSNKKMQIFITPDSIGWDNFRKLSIRLSHASGLNKQADL